MTQAEMLAMLVDSIEILKNQKSKKKDKLEAQKSIRSLIVELHKEMEILGNEIFELRMKKIFLDTALAEKERDRKEIVILLRLIKLSTK